MSYFLALLFRLLNALLTRTFFQPDEFYQSLEPAHSFIFSYGYKTWEWRESLSGEGGIRSVLSWIGFVPIYWILRETGLDETRWLVSG